MFAIWKEMEILLCIIARKMLTVSAAPAISQLQLYWWGCELQPRVKKQYSWVRKAILRPKVLLISKGGVSQFSELAVSVTVDTTIIIRNDVEIYTVYLGVQNECDSPDNSKLGDLLSYYWFVLYLSCAGIQSGTKSGTGIIYFFWDHNTEAI